MKTFTLYFFIRKRKSTHACNDTSSSKKSFSGKGCDEVQDCIEIHEDSSSEEFCTAPTTQNSEKNSGAVSEVKCSVVDVNEHSVIPASPVAKSKSDLLMHCSASAPILSSSNESKPVSVMDSNLKKKNLKVTGNDNACMLENDYLQETISFKTFMCDNTIKLIVKNAEIGEKKQSENLNKGIALKKAVSTNTYDGNKMLETGKLMENKMKSNSSLISRYCIYTLMKLMPDHHRSNVFNLHRLLIT